MTNEEAETAVAEFNANIPDHSDVYASMSAKQWNSTMTALDKTLSAVLEKQNLKATIYSDATINMLLPMLAGLIPSDTIMIGANMTPCQAFPVFNGEWHPRGCSRLPQYDLQLG